MLFCFVSIISRSIEIETGHCKSGGPDRGDGVYSPIQGQNSCCQARRQHP